MRHCCTTNQQLVIEEKEEEEEKFIYQTTKKGLTSCKSLQRHERNQKYAVSEKI